MLAIEWFEILMGIMILYQAWLLYLIGGNDGV
jgi:hypothetical protein